MEISIDLTEEGLLHRDDIIEVIFTYLNLLRTTVKGHNPQINGRQSTEYKLKSYILDEVSQLSYISFQYSENSEPIDFVSGLVADMQVYPTPSEYLIQPHIYPLIPTPTSNTAPTPTTTFPTPNIIPTPTTTATTTKTASKVPTKKEQIDHIKNELYISIETYLNHFHPAQCRIRVISPTFKNRPKNRIAKYYNTEYYSYTLPEQTVKWENIFSKYLSTRLTGIRIRL